MTQFRCEQISQATGDGQIILQANWGSTVPAHDSDAICYWIYNGIPTRDLISGVYLDGSWNLALDPARIVTSKLPVYNLFADPRGMASANPWTRTADNNLTTTQLPGADNNATVAKVTTSYEPLIMSGGGEAFGNQDANAFLFVAAGDGAPSIGLGTWGHKMALPDDVKKALAAGQGVPLGVGWWVAAMGDPGASESTGYDAASLFIYDKAGVLLDTWQIYSELDDFSDGWVWYGGTYPGDFLPAEAANLELLLTWQTGGGVVRKLCFPQVTNSDDLDYHDGDSGGWIWTGAMNNSPSRQSDKAVTETVLDAGDGIAVYCWPVDDRSGDDGWPLFAWSSGGGAGAMDGFYLGSGSGQMSAACKCTQLALGIFLDSDYTWTFATENSSDPPEPYGLTINAVTVYGAAGNPGGDGETAHPSTAHPAGAPFARRMAARRAAFRAAVDAHGPAKVGDTLTVKGLGRFTVEGAMSEDEVKARCDEIAAQREAAKERAAAKATRKPETFEELCARIGRDSAKRAQERQAAREAAKKGTPGPDR